MTADFTIHAPAPSGRRRRRLAWSTTRRLRRKLRKGKILSAHDAFLFDELAPGDVAIDLGANVGEITALMAARGAEVHAFEPDPLAFSVLSEKFADSDLVSCHNVAVSNRAGRMKLYFREERGDDPLVYSVGSTLSAEKTDVDTDAFAEVEVIRFADFVAQFPRVRLLKIDIEGAEADVLDDLLARGLFDRIDLTLVETHEEWIPELVPRMEAIKAEASKRGVRDIYFNWT